MADLSTLTDDFNAASLDTTKWSTALVSGGNVGQSGGVVVLANPAGSGFAQLYAAVNYTRSAGTVVFTNAYVNGSGTSGSAGLLAIQPLSTGTNATQRLEWQFNQGNLIRRWVNAGGANTAVSLGTYDPVAHAWLKITFPTTTTAVFSYSADGNTWTDSPAVTHDLSGSLRVSYYSTLPSNRALIVDSIGVAAWSLTSSPVGINDPDTVSGPALARMPAPATITDPETLTGPTATQALTTSPSPLNDPDTIGAPTAAWSSTASPTTITDPDTATGPTANYPRSPAGISDPETVGSPSAVWSSNSSPNTLNDTDTVGEPLVARWPTPTSIADTGSIGTPAVSFMPDRLYPETITDVGPIGAPAVTFRAFYTGGYGSGLYGQGLYGGYYIGPDGINNPDTVSGPTLGDKPKVNPLSLADPEQVGTPALSGTAIAGNKIYPGSILDGEALGNPSVMLVLAGLYGQGLYGQGLYGQGQIGQTTTQPDDPEYSAPANYGYGAGLYGAGTYFGNAGAPTDTNPSASVGYGSGTYGMGIYYGTSTTPTGPGPAVDALPLFTDIAGSGRPALHILGIGPWSPRIYWRGAANYGVGAGNLPARPALAMPPASSKGFTLRLNDVCEARVELALSRGSAIVIDEMDTDLWWRRKDPRTNTVEMIGRFNTSHVNTATSDSGLNVSLSFEDYRGVLANRMVLRYLSPAHSESLWDEGTLVTDVLAFALPHNSGVDMSEIRGETPYNLGKLTQPFTLAPGTLMSDLMDSLEAISPISWEWWVETPNDINQSPKLRFVLGTRGVNKGVVLFDLGKGPSPIASWTRNNASDNYANVLYYQGGAPPSGVSASGGLIKSIPAQIEQYGERDATYGNSSVYDIAMIRKRAEKKLISLADREPTYTLNLAPGFWRGRSHIDVGDTIRLIIRLGKETINTTYRVTEIDVSIDDNQAEDVTLTLGTPNPSPDPRSRRSPIQRIVRYLRSYVAPDGASDVVTEDD